MTEVNPYDPPQADLGTRRRPGSFRPLVTMVRVFVGLWGLFILAGPSRTGGNTVYHQGQIAAKAGGALLFLVAVFPFGNPSKNPGGDDQMPEDL
jgi:hypothetical protein